MNRPKRPLAEHRRQFDLLTDEVLWLWKALPPRQRLMLGTVHALCAVVAASLGYFGAIALGLQQGYWAAITAISVSQSSYAEVRNSTRDQFLGAMIGSLIGMAVATLGHDQFSTYVLAVMIGMVLCAAFNLGAAGRISGTTTTIIMLVPHQGAFWQFALFRLGEVMLGAIAALLTTVLFNRLERRLFGEPPAA
ncbi:FUSC family protein [Rhodanobacter sp. DHB23]|uniref:FUSC family protein n=1 Tax=Rhodanobacter sp. DHB23 TaxID=2775923 RepID=UPI0017856232|nr:FUSC family protein [Rhodanobacter sp. DHB23]MBD8874095.1 FUSC family protein [Rhodanobacter sp. DHB23]